MTPVNDLVLIFIFEICVWIVSFHIRIQNFSCWEGTHTKRRRNIVMTTITEVSKGAIFRYFLFFYSYASNIVLYFFFFLYQTMMAQAHHLTRKSTSLPTALHLSLPPHPPTQQIQQWAFCRLSPLPWPQVQTPTPSCTRNPPTPPSPRTLQRTANVRAAAVEVKVATPSLTPALWLHPHLPPRSTHHLPQSRLCSTAELLKRSL